MQLAASAAWPAWSISSNGAKSSIQAWAAIFCTSHIPQSAGDWCLHIYVHLIFLTFYCRSRSEDIFFWWFGCIFFHGNPNYSYLLDLINLLISLGMQMVTGRPPADYVDSNVSIA
jgi:hypothetical protein